MFPISMARNVVERGNEKSKSQQSLQVDVDEPEASRALGQLTFSPNLASRATPQDNGLFFGRMKHSES